MRSSDFVSKSPVLGKYGCISCDIPTATVIGKDIITQGGNAADAAIAVAAAVSVALPTMCGIGGDCNIMYYKSSTKTLSSINGSGCSAKDLTLQKVKGAGLTADSVIGFSHGLLVTVPGYVAGIYSCLKHYGSGKFSMAQLLAPAIRLAQSGVPLPPKAVATWRSSFPILESSPNNSAFLVDGHLPRTGDIFYNPLLANCFKELGEDGLEAFYRGSIAERIVAEVRSVGGLLTTDDLAHHLESPLTSNLTDPICIEISGFKLWEMTPNTIGIVALVALNLLKGYNLKDLDHNSSEYIHVVAEALYISYIDCWQFICDPNIMPSAYKHLLTEEYAINRRKYIKLDRHEHVDGHLTEILGSSDTSYVAVVDPDGDACSFIFSNSSAFGSGIIPKDCGFVLHDRGKCFSFDEKSRNCFGPRKRPLHTIIPAMVTDASTGEVVATMGVVGRWMQPQGHVQVLLNMLIFGMDPQTALDMPRFGVGDNEKYSSFVDTTELLYVETGIPDKILSSLKKKGHVIVQSECPLGRGHVIAKQKLWSESSSNVWWAGCDRRSDGAALEL